MERIAQLVIVPVPQASFNLVDDFGTETERRQRRLRLDRERLTLDARRFGGTWPGRSGWPQCSVWLSG